MVSELDSGSSGWGTLHCIHGQDTSPYLPTLQIFPGVSKFFIKSPGLIFREYSYIVLNDIVKMQRFLDVSRFLYSGGWQVCFTLTVPLSTQVNKWLPANFMLGVTLQWTSILSRGEWKYS